MKRRFSFPVPGAVEQNWSLGTWARDISCLHLGPSMLPSDTMVDRRRMVRYPAVARVTIQLSAPDRELFCRAQVQDISRGGIKLRVDRLFETGTVGRVLLKVPLDARVVYASALTDSGWVVGCVFAQELNKGEFKELRRELG